MENSLVERRLAQALASIPHLQQAVEKEPGVMELLTIAAKQQSRADRWLRYEALKGMGTGLVGWGAKQEALRTTQVYEAYVTALDELLPPPLEETA